jgi:hypothetical protein
MKRCLMAMTLLMTGYLSATSVQCSGMPNFTVTGLDGTYVCDGCLPNIVVIGGHHHHED